MKGQIEFGDEEYNDLKLIDLTWQKKELIVPEESKEIIQSEEKRENEEK